MINLPNDIHVVERGWLSANQIFLKNDHTLDIVDSGFCTHANLTITLVNQQLAEKEGRKPGKLLNTHLHSDHCGGNQVLADQFHFEIYIPSGEWDVVHHWDEAQLSYESLGQPCPQFKPEYRLVANTSIELGDRRWQILAAPGHDPHSIILFQEQTGILISADALWENGFGALFPELENEEGFQETRATLDLIKDIQPALVIPGHGKPFTNVKEALDIAYSRLDYLEADSSRNDFHIAKVLLKFKILELQEVEESVAQAWMSQTPMLNIVSKNLGLTHEELFIKTVNALINAKAIYKNGSQIINLN